MKKATRKTATRNILKIDTEKYAEIYVDPPINFCRSDIDMLEKAFYMAEDEFSNLRPRLIHEEIIGWEPKEEGEKGRNAIKARIYITDGIRTINKDHKINVAYSYFVRFHSETTWKLYSLPRCFELINAIRLQQIKIVRQEIVYDKREEEREKKAAAKK